MKLSIAIFLVSLFFFLAAFSQTDQNLIYASYHGGIASELGTSMDVLPDGSSIVAGRTESFNMPHTDDAFQGVYQGNGDIFMARFDPQGSFTYGTFLGGSASDHLTEIKFKSDGGYVIAGSTSSENFPVSENAHQDVFYNPTGFIAAFGPDNALIWSTFIGGEGDMSITAMDVDVEGNIYIAGPTNISGMGTPGVHQDSFPDIYNTAYISKFSVEGEQLWLTYFYGSESEDHVFFRAISLSADGSQIFVSGRTPEIEGVVSNPHQEDYGGGYQDGIISSFSSENATLNWSTYYGGEENDSFVRSAVADDGTLFIIGESNSDANIASSGVHQEWRAGGIDHFLTAFNPDGTRLWGTYFGGPLTEFGIPRISLTSTSILVVGLTQSLENIAFGSPMETESNAEVPFTYTSYIAKFNQDMGTLSWGTYFLGLCPGIVSVVKAVNDSRFIGTGWIGSGCNEFITDDAFQNFPGGAEDVGFYIFDDMTVSTDNIKYEPLSVYPNPSADLVQISLPEGAANQMHLQVFDLQGRIVQEQANLFSGGMLDVSALPPAVYVLIGKTNENYFRQKLVVTR